MRSLVLLFVLVAPATPSLAKSSAPLGRVDFSVTGGAEARRHFARGVAALHSFWYEEARDEFREATRVQPDFAMGYWGEALTYFHPVWGEEDVAAETKALDAAAAHREVTQRELAFVAAARLLVGEGDFAAHAAHYAAAMRAMHERWPDDDEVTMFFAVALLGTVDRKSTVFHSQAEAAALSLEVFARNPDHPGAAHYIIHAFDDPDHAILALPAARRYAQIAPEAFHARHMPSHIFVHLGMWLEAAAANESSWAASQAWVAKRRLDSGLADFHSLSWLQAIYLELGQRAKADEVLARARAALTTSKDEHVWMRANYARLVNKNVVEAEDWSRLDEKLAPLAAAEPSAAVPEAPPPLPKNPALPANCHPAKESDVARAQRMERTWLTWLRGEAAIAKNDAAGAARAADELAAVAPKDGAWGDVFAAGVLTLRGRVAIVRGAIPTGLALLTKAADLEDRETPSGPIESGVGARERLGAALLAANRPADALREFRRALALHPRRARLLLGCGRAAAAAHDASAARYWSELADVWSHADAGTPGLDEARRAVAAR